MESHRAIVPLNLPTCPLRLRHALRGDEIFDPLRVKWLMLTPEEWVRQNFTAFLRTILGYPATLMANEIAITLNGTSKRCDTVVYDRCGSPLMIVEYKAPSVRLTQEVFDQIARYSLALRVPYLTVSNGLHHYCCRIDPATRRYTFLREIPDYQSINT
ncbi:MAG: type I restriction enzyme HsdR N-terminal domain-containing protein [Bacteroides sp.]|nr:type I restriction enzyme HsdR N-terminal domain-containing protein [Bacteroides sp.]